MDTEALWNSFLGKIFIRLIGAIMDSRLRYVFWKPEKILAEAGLSDGMNILEVGCGTGFFTIPAAGMVGTNGHITSIDVLSKSVELVTEKIKQQGITNATILQRNALDTKLDSQSFDRVFVFGVIPAPMLPADQLSGELHRLLKPDGVLAVWPPSWVKGEIEGTGLFKFQSTENGVMRFNKI
jgi:demethylmenaquinone methyltransferase/2-methoxy-6-polyprenyl-1,4-benzoquinol methylase